MQSLSGNSSQTLVDRHVLQVEVITLTFLCPSLVLLSGMPFVGPAFDTALEDAKKTYPFLNITQRIVSRNEADCNWFADYENVLSAFYFKSDRQRWTEFDLTAFVMAGSNDAVGVARLAREENKLLITSVASKDSQPYSNWVTTTISSMPTYLKAYENMARMFNWTNIVMLCDVMPSRNPFQQFVAEIVRKRLEGMKNRQITLLNFDSGLLSEPADYMNLLHNISGISRVVLYFGIWSSLRDFLFAAETLNMTSGDYIFIGIISYRFPSLTGSFDLITRDASYNITKSAFRCFVLIENLLPNPNDNLTRLYDHWKTMSHAKYNYTYDPDDPVSPYAAPTYAALMSLAEVIDEISQHKTPEKFNDGIRLAERFSNRTFALRTGKFRINSRGERIPSVAITQTDIFTGNIKVIMEKEGEEGELTMAANAIDWPSTWPVPNEPVCGFTGYKAECLHSGGRIGTIYGASFGAITAVIVIQIVIIYVIRYGRRYWDKAWWQLNAKYLNENYSWRYRRWSATLE